MAEQIAPQLGDDALGGHRQQIDLDVVEHRLDSEQSEQAESNLVEKLSVSGNERCVEEIPDYLREGECDSDAEEKTEHRSSEA